MEVPFTPAEENAILQFLNGTLSSRSLGEALGCTHQQSINIVSSICRDWYQKGFLTFKKVDNPRRKTK